MRCDVFGISISLDTSAQHRVFVFVLFNRLNRKRVKHRLEFDSGGRKWINLGEEQVRAQVYFLHDCVGVNKCLKFGEGGEIGSARDTRHTCCIVRNSNSEEHDGSRLQEDNQVSCDVDAP